MTNVQSLPQVLDHIDIERWGSRKAELVQLVGALQVGPNPVPLGRKILMAMGRSDRQARYDHEVLMGLVEDRVLARWRGDGRNPDCWAVCPIDRWRGVRWRTPRREVIRLFSCPLPDAAVALWTKTAGQPWRSDPLDPRMGGSAGAGLSVNHWSTTPRHLATTPRPLREPAPQLVHYATAPSVASPSYLESEFTPSLTPPSRREGGSDDQQIEEGAAKLLQAVRAAVQTKVFGAPADRIRQVARDHPDQVDALVTYARELQGIKTATGAAQMIEAQAHARPAPPAVSIEDRIRNLRQRIATLEDFNPDDEQLPILRAQLDDLAPSLSTVTPEA